MGLLTHYAGRVGAQCPGSAPLEHFPTAWGHLV
jgi:hypothetical protein